MTELKKGTSKYYEWEESVEFIRRELQFYSKEDFLEHKSAIKALYIASNDLEKQLYKWYVYSRCMSYALKCNIWEFLNNPNLKTLSSSKKKKKKRP